MIPKTDKVSYYAERMGWLLELERNIKVCIRPHIRSYALVYDDFLSMRPELPGQCMCDVVDVRCEPEHHYAYNTAMRKLIDSYDSMSLRVNLLRLNREELSRPPDMDGFGRYILHAVAKDLNDFLAAKPEKYWFSDGL